MVISSHIFAEVHLVEEVPDQDADAAVRGHDGARLPAAPLRRLRIPLAVRLLHRHARRSLPRPLRSLLHQGVLDGQESQISSKRKQLQSRISMILHGKLNQGLFCCFVVLS